MTDDQELYEITVAEWLRETPKAIQVRTTAGTEHWLAKSQIAERGGDYVMIPQWLADKAKIAQHIEERSA
jgi:hypothetical protein